MFRRLFIFAIAAGPLVWAGGCVVESDPHVYLTDPSWRYSGKVLYSNDQSPDAGAVCLPYILGGTDVRTPTIDTLAAYQKAGYLRDMNLDQLQNLYRLEGITWQQQGVEPPGVHVLEGGNTLVAPLGGTLGYDRIFCTPHPGYRPKSPDVIKLRDQLSSQINQNRPVGT